MEIPTPRPSLSPRKVAKLLRRKTGRFSQTFQSLNEAHSVSELIFRQKEKDRIAQFVRESLTSGGSNSALYITGLPGLGKTACVMEVLEGLGKNQPFATLFVNALRLNTPSKFYRHMWTLVSGGKTSNAEACHQLHDYFHGRIPSENMRLGKEVRKVLVIDEVDYLLSRKQEVLYNLFDWMHAPKARLSVICISNTLDLLAKLIGKIKSRVGNNVLVFKPYSSAEVLEILRLRLGANTPAGEERCVFTRDALHYVAKKVANFTSDIRKSFDICRRALHEFLTNPAGRDRITVELVSQVLTKEANKPLCNFFAGCSDLLQVFVVAILVLKAVNTETSFRSDVVLGRVNAILKLKHQPELSPGQLQSLAERASKVGLVRLRDFHKCMFGVALAADSDDLSFALRENQDFLRFGPLIEAQKEVKP